MFNQQLFNKQKCAELLGKICIPLVDLKFYKTDHILPSGRRCSVSSVAIDGDGEFRISVRELGPKGSITPFTHSMNVEKFNKCFILV
jgi:hypothetical protein